jgi:hypothetical protein
VSAELAECTLLVPFLPERTRPFGKSSPGFERVVTAKVIDVWTTCVSGLARIHRDVAVTRCWSPQIGVGDGRRSRISRVISSIP